MDHRKHRPGHADRAVPLDPRRLRRALRSCSSSPGLLGVLISTHVPDHRGAGRCTGIGPCVGRRSCERPSTSLVAPGCDSAWRRRCRVVVTPAKLARRVATSVLFALGLPTVILVAWDALATSPDQATGTAKYYPDPLTVGRAFADNWIGPAFADEVLPSLGRLAIGIIASIVVGVAAGTASSD